MNDIGALNVIFNYQPSAGTEVAITNAGAYTAWVYLTDGTNVANVWNWGSETGIAQTTPQKLFINNTNYVILVVLEISIRMVLVYQE